MQPLCSNARLDPGLGARSSRVAPGEIRPLRTGVAELEQVGDHDVLAARRQVEGVGELLDAEDLLPVRLEERAEGEEGEVDHLGLEAGLLEQLRGALLADDRQLHHERAPPGRQEPGEQLQEVIEEVAAPVVERPVAGRLLVGIDRHLVQARAMRSNCSVGSQW